MKQILQIFFSSKQGCWGYLNSLLSQSSLTAWWGLILCKSGTKCSLLFCFLTILSHSSRIRDTAFLVFHQMSLYTFCIPGFLCFQVAFSYHQTIWWASTITSSKSYSKSVCCSPILIFSLCLFLWGITLHLSALHFICSCQAIYKGGPSSLRLYLLFVLSSPLIFLLCHLASVHYSWSL